MPRSELSKKNKYWLPKQEYLTAKHYALRYPGIIKELLETAYISGLTYDSEAVQHSGDGDPIARIVSRREKLNERKDTIEQAAIEADAELTPWIIRGACYGDTWQQLYQRGIPCARDRYYEARRAFFFHLSKKI